jgi:hypothetical protein
MCSMLDGLVVPVQGSTFGEQRCDRVGVPEAEVDHVTVAEFLGSAPSNDASQTAFPCDGCDGCDGCDRCDGTERSST